MNTFEGQWRQWCVYSWIINEMFRIGKASSLPEWENFWQEGGETLSWFEPTELAIAECAHKPFNRWDQTA